MNKFKESNDLDIVNAIEKIAEIVSNSKDETAKAVFEKFNEELVSQKPNKSKLKQLWIGLNSILPSLSTIAGIAETISKLFK